MDEYELQHENDSDLDDIRYDAISALSDDDIEAIRQYRLDTRDLGYD